MSLFRPVPVPFLLCPQNVAVPLPFFMGVNIFFQDLRRISLISLQVEGPPPKKNENFISRLEDVPFIQCPCRRCSAGRGAGMPPAPAEIMPPSVFQLQHIPKSLLCLPVFICGRRWSMRSRAPASALWGGIRSRAIFSGDIRATLPFFRSSFGVRGGYSLLVRSLFVLCSFVLSRLCRVRCDFLVVRSLFVGVIRIYLCSLRRPAGVVM